MKKPVVTKEHPPAVARRLNWLEYLIDSEYGSRPAFFEEKTGVRMSQVSQWFSGNRMLRDNALATLAAKTGKPAEWFERPIDALIYDDEGRVTAVIEMKAPSAPTKGPHKTEVERALGIICDAVARADDLTRLQLEPLFSLLAKSEKDTVKISQRIALLLGESARAQQAPDHGGRSANVAVDDFTVKGDKGDAKGGGSEEQADQTGRGGKTGGAAGQS